MSNNIYDILKKIESLEAPKKTNLTESKMTTVKELHNESKKEKQTRKGTIAEAVAQVEKQLSEKFHNHKKAVEESGLMYHAGVEKHGKKYMELAKKAGQKGASQEELGRLKDKHSKAYKNKKMDENPLNLVAPAVGALGAGDVVRRGNDLNDDPVGALSSVAGGALGGLGMIPGPQQPLFLGGSLGIMGVNQLRDAAKRAGGWKQLGKQIFTSPDPDHTFLPEDFDKLDLIANLLERSGQIDKDGSLSKLIITEWGPDASKWLVKKFSKGKIGEAYVINPRFPGLHADEEGRLEGPYNKERAIYGDPNDPLAQKGFQRAQDIHGRLHKVMKKKPNLKVSEADYNEDMLSPKQKSFAALAEPKDKITYADKIAGAKHDKMDEAVDQEGPADLLAAVEQEINNPGRSIDNLTDVLNATFGSNRSPEFKKARAVIGKYIDLVDNAAMGSEQDGIAPMRGGNIARHIQQYDLTDYLQHAAAMLDKAVKGPLGEGNYNEDMLSAKEKSFAALAEPKDKITYADKIAGAKKGKKDEGNEFSGELVKARAQGKDSFEVDGKSYPVKEGELSAKEKWMNPDNTFKNPKTDAEWARIHKSRRDYEADLAKDGIKPPPWHLKSDDDAALNKARSQDQTDRDADRSMLNRLGNYGSRLFFGRDMPVNEGGKTMREGWEEMQKYLEKKKGPQSKGGEGKKSGTRYGGSAQKDDDEETDGEGKTVEKKKGRPKGTGGGAKFSFKKPKD